MIPLDISIPHQCQNEIKYTFHCLITEFLGIDIQFVTDTSFEGYTIHCPNGNIQIENHFFNNEIFDILYSKDNIPKKIQKTHWSINNIKYPLVSLFGKPELIRQNNNFRLSSDIISATFFMLTRWEEYVVKIKDDHSRFSSKEALSVKQDFNDRPIVNEYIEILWALLKTCGYKGERQPRNYNIVPTHDVDFPYKWNGIGSVIKTIGGKILKRNSKGFFRELKFALQHKDPYDTYDQLINLADKKGVKAHFFFISGGDTNFDKSYNISHPRIIKLINKIKKRGHLIGIHPSYNSYINNHVFSKEKQKLEKITKQSITIGRQHFLRFEVPTTWNIWNDNKMLWESSMTYADHSGFRCGICYPYPVFDILEQKMLSLYEKPLIVMDVTIAEHEGLNQQNQIIKLRKLKNEVKKYNGEFVFLWHNSSFNEGVWLDETILKELYS